MLSFIATVQVIPALIDTPGADIVDVTGNVGRYCDYIGTDPGSRVHGEQRIELELAAEVLDPLPLRLRVRLLRCRSDLVAPIGRRHEQCAEPRAVGGS